MVKNSHPDLSRSSPPCWATADPRVIGLLKSDGFRTVAALTGGIASGKSFIGELFALLGADIIDFDILARQAVEPGTWGWQAVKNLFGPQVIEEDGQLNRARLGEIVFSDPGLKEQLENIIHPEVWRLMGASLEKTGSRLVIAVIPLLFEARLNSLFSPIILSFTDKKIQLKRLRARSPLKAQEAPARLKSQLPAEPKIPHCDFIIDNSASPIETIRQTKEVFQQLTGLSRICS